MVKKMKYTDSIVLPAFQQYFGKRHDKWQTTLNGILNDKGLTDEQVNDQNQKKFKSSITFSWLGLLFNILWYAYHGGKNWLAFTFVIAAYSVFMGVLPLILGFEIWLSTQWVFLLISFIPAVLLAMFAKPYILATKFDEVSRTGGSIQPASWGRLFGALSILVVATMVSQAIMISFLFQQF
jgi:hypothetical protein